jgi:hypothetical protein
MKHLLVLLILFGFFTHSINAQYVGGGVGSPGPAGPKGDKGDAVASVTAGYASNGVPGSTVIVTNTGTSNNAVFSFVIPIGATGTAGATGSQGIQGIQGIQGVTGTAATITVGTVSNGTPGSAASITNTGTSNNAVFSFVIPIGATGVTGNQGIQGTQGIQGVVGPTGVTGATGSQGIQGIQGTQGIQGVVGPTGATGIQGIQGIQGIPGSMYRYVANNTSGAEVDIMASTTNVTATWDVPSSKLTLNIPAGSVLFSMRVRVPPANHAGGNWTLNLGTNDMINTSLATRWGATFNAINENSGAVIATAGCRYDLANNAQLIIYNMSATYTCACIFNF